MTYKLEAFIEKIKSPIVCIFGDKEVEYADGRELSKDIFDRYWLVESISAHCGKIVLELKENDKINAVSCNESFF